MTLVLVTERPMSTLEVKKREPLLEQAQRTLDNLLSEYHLPYRTSWWLTTLYQPTKFRKKWQAGVVDLCDGLQRLQANLDEWCAPEQYPMPVVVTLGKALALNFSQYGFSLDDDFGVPHKLFGEQRIWFPLAAEAEDFYHKRPPVRLQQAFARLGAYINAK